MFTMLVTAFTIGLAVSMPPGPVTISGSQRAITNGFWHACNFYFGSILSDAFYALLVYFGLSALLADSPLFRLGLWLIGGAWLCWMGVDALRARIDLREGEGAAKSESRWTTFRSGLLLTLFNPMVIVGWVALAGNFFNTSWQADWPPLATTGFLAVLTMLAGALAWVLILALFLSALRRVIHPRLMTWISVVGGLFLIYYGLSAWYAALDMLI